MRYRVDHTEVNYSRHASARRWIVIHYTGNKTDTAAGNASYFRTEQRGASAHIFVDETEAVEVVPLDCSSWAVGVNHNNGRLYGICTNDNSISIELCSRDGTIQPETLKNAAEVVRNLMQTFLIDSDHVVRHYDVCGKCCPGWSGWLPPDENKWSEFKKLLMQREDSEDMGDQCFYTIDGKATVYYYNGEKICSLNHPDQVEVLQTIHKANTGKEIPLFKWTSAAPWHERLKQVVKRMEEQNK